MNRVYRKLFDITCNNKIFTIFLDENNRRTFLEKNEKGDYVYPTLDDFIYLTNLYNNVNPFIANVQKYTFQEKVLKTSLGVLVAVTVMGSPLHNLSYYHVNATENEVEVTKINNNQKEEVEIKDSKQLDELLGYKEVSIEEIHVAIDTNNQIPNMCKKILHKFIDALIEEYPTMDLRVFYENIKTINFLVVDSNYFKEQGLRNIHGQYNAMVNQITVLETISEAEIYHELAHVTDLYYREQEGKVIYKAPVKGGSALNEAMANRIAKMLPQTSYDKYGAVLEYLMNLVDFDCETYSRKGIGYLIEQLKEKYPTVDIDYIVLALDTMQRLEANGDYIYLDQSESLIEELYKICTIEFIQTPENYYEPFSNFSKLLFYTRDRQNSEPNIMYQYLEKYNILLQKKEMKCITKEDIIEKCSPYNNIVGLTYLPNSIHPLIQDRENKERKTSFQMIKGDGKLEDINFDYNIKSDEYLKYYMQLTCIENYEILGTENYWEKIGFERNLIDRNQYLKIPILWNGTLLKEECLSNLNLSLGYNPNGTVGYKITNSQEEIIYTSSPSLTNTTNAVNIGAYFTKINKSLDYMELSTIFQQKSFIEMIKEENLFYNALIKDGEISLIPNYQLSLTIGSKTSTARNLGEFYFVNEGEEIYICPFYKANELSEKIYLKNVLDYYNMLNEKQLYYNFTEEYLIELYQNYINDLSLLDSKVK